MLVDGRRAVERRVSSTQRSSGHAAEAFSERAFDRLTHEHDETLLDLDDTDAPSILPPTDGPRGAGTPVGCSRRRRVPG
jgi:hypothetical protein